MKFVFTSDWHLGLVTSDIDRTEEIMSVLKEIARKTIELSKEEEGYIALGDWMKFSGLDIIVTSNTNFRSTPEISNNVIRLLPRGTKLKTVEEIKQSGGYNWIKVKL